MPLFLPPTIGLLVGILYCSMDEQETTLFINGYLYNNSFASLSGVAWLQAGVHLLAKVLFAVGVLVVMFMGFHYIQQYHQMIETVYADTEGKTLYRIRNILVLLIVTSVASFVANAIGRYQFADSLGLLALPSILFSLLLFGIGYVGFCQDFSYANIRQDLSDDEDDNTVDVKPIPLLEDILRLMMEERIYLRQDLRLSDIACMLGTNRTYVYRALHDGLGVSFAEFVNRRRIEYAKRLMEEHPDWKQADVALKSGYSSIATFYRNLKLYGDSAEKKL